MKRIGIIGYGFVGAAVARSFAGQVHLFVCDTSPERRNLAISELHERRERIHSTRQNQGVFPIVVVPQVTDLPAMDAVFVCVPTPTIAETGQCDTSILKQVITQLRDHRITDTIISKCTAPVSEYADIPVSDVAYSPEFLRAAHAAEDYQNQSVITVGADCPLLAERAASVYQFSSIRHASVQVIPRAAAIMAKYAHNVSLAVKVAVMNEIKQSADHLGVDWKDVIAGLRGTHVRRSHVDVPGPDGHPGFGGACFPKDVAAYLHEREQLDLPADVTTRAFVSWCRTDLFDDSPITCGMQLESSHVQ